MNTIIGTEARRVDGRDKVTGGAHYAADFDQPGQAYAVIVGATVGLGRITAIDDEPVLGMPGIVAVISHLNAPHLAYGPHKSFIDPAIGERLHVLQDDHIHFYGQPVAVVVADTLDNAERGALALRTYYAAAEQPMVDPYDDRANAILPEAFGIEHADRTRGDIQGKLAADAVTVDSEFEIARQNHTPIELHATLAAWRDDKLTLWSKSQFVGNEQAEVAAIFGIRAENVQVICPFIGGAFGTSLRTWPHVTLAALAAKLTRRPVKLVLSRRQTFHATGHRPRTLQRVALSATPEGKLLRIVHEGKGETSRYEQFTEALTSATPYLYSCPNVHASYRLQPLDTSTPTHMRGPGEASGIFALESAMDELAYALKMDPLELRRRNEPQIDEETQRPFSSRSMLACYDMGAERFGWSRRQPDPGAMRDGRLLLGWGMASGTYPTWFVPSEARVRVLGNGKFQVEAAASDMGPGTYTSMTQIAADTLGVPMDQVSFRLGLSDYPPVAPHGGSMTMASVGTAIQMACQSLQAELATLMAASGTPAYTGVPVQSLAWKDGRLARPGQNGVALGYDDVLAQLGREQVEVTTMGARDPLAHEKFSMHAFGAVFVEVAIDPAVLTMQVRRIVGAYDAGRIINPRLARSQCISGMVGGIGMALMESTFLDKRDGRPVNAHMADYLVPVNLDMGTMEPYFVEGHDPHANPLGVKGLGEIALVGVAPAIANAVFHATGKRVRRLPIRIESLLDAA